MASKATDDGLPSDSKLLHMFLQKAQEPLSLRAIRGRNKRKMKDIIKDIEFKKWKENNKDNIEKLLQEVGFYNLKLQKSMSGFNDDYCSYNWIGGNQYEMYYTSDGKIKIVQR